MNDTDPQKQGKSLRLENGGSKQRRHHELPDQWLDREMRSAFAGWYGEKGTIPSRGIYNVAEGCTHPWRPLARRIREAAKGNTPKEKVKETLRKLVDEYVEKAYRERRA